MTSILKINDVETPLRDSLGDHIFHGMVVSNLAYMVGKEMGMDDTRCHDLAVAGLIHDIGKLRLRSYVYIEKQAVMLIDELRYVRLHPALGYAMLKKYGYSDEIVKGVLYHHENIDGSGYPDNRKGEEIPLFGRILRICDAFGGLMTNRLNGKKFDLDEALLIMVEDVKHYDMLVYLAFQRVALSKELKEMLLEFGIA